MIISYLSRIGEQLIPIIVLQLGLGGCSGVDCLQITEHILQDLSLLMVIQVLYRDRSGISTELEHCLRYAVALFVALLDYLGYFLVEDVDDPARDEIL